MRMNAGQVKQLDYLLAHINGATGNKLQFKYETSEFGVRVFRGAAPLFESPNAGDVLLFLRGVISGIDSLGDAMARPALSA